MIATLLFTLIAALLVLLAGRKDAARDPRLTITLLVICSAFPFFAVLLPKWSLLPHAPLPDTINPAATLPWAAVILLIWAAGVWWQLARIGRAMLRLHAWKKQSTVQERIEGIPVLLCKSIESPVAAGIWQPVILVPPTWSEWSPSCRDVVLAHELEHHRRHDPQWRLLAALACAIHWYHPLVHWMTQRYILQTEFACDRSVIDSGIEAERYANNLCDVASNAHTTHLAVAMAESHSLESRVRRMMQPMSTRAKTASLLLFSVVGISSAAALATIERKPNFLIPPEEVELRLSADPFPGEP